MNGFPINLLKALEQLGSLGVFFVMWFIDKKFQHRESEARKEEFKNELRELKEELKESNRRQYEQGQKAETHMLTNIGGTVELKARVQDVHDKLDVLLRRGDHAG